MRQERRCHDIMGVVTKAQIRVAFALATGETIPAATLEAEWREAEACAITTRARPAVISNGDYNMSCSLLYITSLYL